MLDEEMRYFLEYCRISDFSKKSIESLSIYNGGSGQASLLIFNGYRSKNRCFQALYHSFRPQNGHYRVQMALGADSLPRFFWLFFPWLAHPAWISPIKTTSRPATPGLLISRYLSSSGLSHKETVGSRKFHRTHRVRVTTHEYMPLRDVVSTLRGVVPYGTESRRSPGLRPRWRPVHSPYRKQDCCFPTHCTASAFTSDNLRLILMTTTIHPPAIACHFMCFMDLGYWQWRAGISGLNTEPVEHPGIFGASLLRRWNIPRKRGFRLPLPGLHVDFTTDLLASGSASSP